MNQKIEKVKKHFEDNKKVYVIGVNCLVVAGITLYIMRDIKLKHISRGISVTADRGISVIGKNISMNNVSYISANRQGAPSWVVRCLENNLICASQRAMALSMCIPESELSKHLNGIMDNVRGYHFERICMAA